LLIDIEDLGKGDASDYHQKITEYIEDLKVKRSSIDNMDYEFNNMVNEEYFLNSLGYGKEEGADSGDPEKYAMLQNLAKMMGNEEPGPPPKKDKLAFFNEM